MLVIPPCVLQILESQSGTCVKWHTASKFSIYPTDSFSCRRPTVGPSLGVLKRVETPLLHALFLHNDAFSPPHFAIPIVWDGPGGTGASGRPVGAYDGPRVCMLGRTHAHWGAQGRNEWMRGGRGAFGSRAGTCRAPTGRRAPRTGLRHVDWL